MRNPFLFFIIFVSLILIIDLYSYRGLKKLINNYRPNVRKTLKILFWSVPSLIIIGLLIFNIFRSSIEPSNFLKYFHLISGAFILFYLPKLIFNVFVLIEDVIVLVKKLVNRKRKKESAKELPGKPISRAQFLTRAGILIAGIDFLSIGYGIGWGRFNYTVRKQVLKFSNLPASFNGIKLVQISDFHIGSFLHHKNKVEEAVDVINDQSPDLLVFTGDFVNNVASEVDAFIPVLKKLNTKIGKFSVLGNHDYGEYVPWKSLDDRKNNLDRLIGLQEEVGFNVLLNSSQQIQINGEAIELIGVENWGLPPFPQYGDLERALSNVNQDSFKILLSHDPTHWDEQVLDTNIDLTLSGHTHGAQFGIEIPGWRWSPVSMRYKRWGGLYQEGDQYINVNTGIGFIGFPGRVGMPPEITVIELQKA